MLLLPSGAFIMLEYSEILPKKFILLDGAPYEVLDAHVFRKQQRKPVKSVGKLAAEVFVETLKDGGVDRLTLTPGLGE